MATHDTPDLIAVGELLIDLISADYVDSLAEACDFRRLPGGSPANMAGNLARLGKRVSLVATVGNDDAGELLKHYVQVLGLDTTYLRHDDQPSTLILVTRSREVSRFEAYRAADCEIMPSQLPIDWVTSTRILHTTCFALSREPAQSSILGAAEAAAAAGVQLSIDANYAQKIWPNRPEAQRIVDRYLALGAMAKFSEVDWQRLYGEVLTDPETAAAQLLRAGAKVACLTLGEKGCYVAGAGEQFFLESRPVEVNDTTGAGDAFWAGFLCAYLDGESLRRCARAGRALAERKLRHFGPLPHRLEVADIYCDFED